MKIQFTSSPSCSDIDFLTQKINQETLGKGTAYPFAFFIRNKDNDIIAGCNGSVVFGIIYTDQLWVHFDYRKQGIGRNLMEKVHDFGKREGCRIATVATMTFQNTRVFYEKLGYIIDFERPGYQNGSSCFF